MWCLTTFTEINTTPSTTITECIPKPQHPTIIAYLSKGEEQSEVAVDAVLFLKFPARTKKNPKIQQNSTNTRGCE